MSVQWGIRENRQHFWLASVNNSRIGAEADDVRRVGGGQHLLASCICYELCSNDIIVEPQRHIRITRTVRDARVMLRRGRTAFDARRTNETEPHIALLCCVRVHAPIITGGAWYALMYAREIYAANPYHVQ